MFKIDERLFIGNDTECFQNSDGWVTIHACKSPCHQNAVGYKGSLPSTHPNYLVFESGNNLFLNLIDPPTPLFMKQSFDVFFKFAEKKYNDGKTLFIHCNQCESRAPSLALLFLAKKIKKINNESYQVARSEFQKIYPFYNPGQGIKDYLGKNWNFLN